ncbi:alpha/beta fold hydrolase [Clostridium estertheticum]|uniref:alpha/beta fold hydrolase n=1 Tax=Clostridium estertheticum TaxID=238834 RepID=UPI001C6E62F5|nr:alpha/beta hydrolase [Clostridium estertheticum]MBW9153872.1 alpha/beta hydrolase [Clostridium estertheticum]WLC86490.1 alpha/beta hydrolase [Clostridium estertheticum]
MKTIYKTADSKYKVLQLYDDQLSKLNVPYKDLYIDTSFGKTHLIETGNLTGKPLLVFHGGNATTSCSLLTYKFLVDYFHVYAVDTIGHPGKSSEHCLSPNNYDYGKWASEVITALHYDKMCCFGSSFGAGILAKMMCVSPEKIKKSVLIVPSGIKNAPAYKSISMLLPMIMYRITHKDFWFKKCILPMVVTEENIDSVMYETAKCSIDNVKIKAGMPSNVIINDMKKCTAPTLVMAGEKDCLFPANLVIPQAEIMIPNCTPYLLKDRGHMHYLMEDEKRKIVDFLN